MKYAAILFAALALVACGKRDVRHDHIKPTAIYNGCIRASVNVITLTADQIITACEARQRRAEALVNSMKVEN